MAAAVPFIIAASAVVSAVGAIQQGKAAEAAANFNATVAQQNAQIVRTQAKADARQSERETYLRLGAIRAAQGKSGGAAGEGSVLDILGDTAAQGELEKQDIIYRGELRARGFTNDATLDIAQGKAAKTAGYLKAGTDLLSGGVNAYGAYTKLNRTT